MSLRTAQSHAAFFLPQLKPGMSVLDCGCGPGTITLGLAALVAPGQVVGTEIEDSHVALARENAAKLNVPNARFEAADIYALPFADASFDAVFISAVLGNLREPIRGLREAYRVLKPGGVIGVKEFDHGGDLITHRILRSKIMTSFIYDCDVRMATIRKQVGRSASYFSLPVSADSSCQRFMNRSRIPTQLADSRTFRPDCSRKVGPTSFWIEAGRLRKT